MHMHGTKLHDNIYMQGMRLLRSLITFIPAQLVTSDNPVNNVVNYTLLIGTASVDNTYMSIIGRLRYKLGSNIIQGRAEEYN